MPEVQEYTYSDRSDHLSDAEAISEYGAARSEHPDALVVLQDLDCGHWQVKVYETPAEKDAFFKRQLQSMFRTFMSVLKP